jgi:toxin CcdB
VGRPSPAQFDAFRLASGTVVVVIQSDLLDAAATRVVVPLLPVEALGRRMTSLNPDIVIGDTRFCLAPQLMATVPVSDLTDQLGSLAHRRDVIIRAVDALLSGL